MAYNRASVIFLIVVHFVAITNRLAHGQLFVGLSNMNFEGRLCCTTTGNCPGQGIPGVPVSITCTINGYTDVAGQGTTDVNGAFNVYVLGITGYFYGLSTIPCVATVQLPLDTVVCPALNTTTGLLSSAFRRNGTANGSLKATIVGFVRT
ncbi:hypothetical protein ABFS83_10G117700 [Erythranthe nasuta]